MTEEIIRIAIAEVLNAGDDSDNDWCFETAAQDYYDFFVERVIETIKRLER